MPVCMQLWRDRRYFLELRHAVLLAAAQGADAEVTGASTGAGTGGGGGDADELAVDDL